MQKRILVAVLNWGLGHASRSIPIIQALEKRGHEVLIASDGDALALLRLEFPHLQYLELPAYKVRYRYHNMFLNIAPQLPKLFRAIALERRFLKTIISSYKIDALISDNRFGLSTSTIPTVFLSHQLHILIGNSMVSAWVNRINRRLRRKFDLCWVPDYAGQPNLAGELAHKGPTDEQLRFIGPLSRLNPPAGPVAKQWDVLALLSGPEPQRSYLERLLIQQLKATSLRALIVQGRIRQGGAQQLGERLWLRPYLNAAEIEQLLPQAELLVLRSGYSSLMDLAKLRSPKALLIPTPGQTEQEYLANKLAREGIYLQQSQKELDLQQAWDNRNTCKGFSAIKTTPHALIEAIQELETRCT